MSNNNKVVRLNVTEQTLEIKYKSNSFKSQYIWEHVLFKLSLILLK